MRKALVLLALAASGGANAEAGEPPKSLMRQESIIFSLATVGQQAIALGRIAGKSVVDSPQMPRKFEIVSSGNPGRTEMVLKRAQTHLLLGDPARAENIVRDALPSIDEFSSKTSSSFLRILFESKRLQEKYLQAAETCQTYLTQGGTESDIILSCAHSVSQSANKKMPQSERLNEKKLTSFAYARQVRDSGKNKIPVAILITTAFQQLDKPKEAMDYIERTLGEVSASDPWYARGQLVLALSRLQNGARENAIRALRKLSKEATQDDIFSSETRIDQTTEGLAHLALARIFFSGGYATESKRRYESAIVLLENGIQTPSERKIQLGSIREADDNPSVLTLGSALSTNEVRREATILFCTNHSGSDCPKTFKETSAKSDNDIPNLATRKNFLANANRETLTNLLGKTEADLEFLGRLAGKNSVRSVNTIIEETQLVARIAETYDSSSRALTSLTFTAAASLTMRKNALDAHEQLVSALTPAMDSYLGNNAPYRSAMERFGALVDEANSQLQVLDLLARKNWRADSTSTATADEHRRALHNRLQALSDPLLQLAQQAERNQTPTRMLAITQDLSTLKRDLTISAAQIGSAKFLLEHNDSDDEKRGNRTMSKARDEAKETSQQMVDLDLAVKTSLLNSKNPHTPGALLLDRIAKTQKTAVTLSDVHDRMFTQMNDNVDDIPVKQLRSLWKRLFETYDKLLENVSSVEEKNNEERRVIATEARQVLKEKVDLEIDAVKLADLLREEARRSLPEAITATKNSVAATRDAIRLALAMGEGERISDSRRMRDAVARAKEERKHWMETLRESLNWELGR